MFVSLLLLVPMMLQDGPLPVVVVTGPVEITESCVLRIPVGQVVADAQGVGAIRIRGEGLTVRFEEGSVLRGAAKGLAQDEMTGVGIHAEDAPGLRLLGARVEGYRAGIVLTQCDDAEVAGAELRRNYAQHLQSTTAREDQADWLFPHANDDQEWERHHGAGLSIHRSRGVRVHDVVVRAQQNGILLDRVEDSFFYDNDASFLSGWGLAMWRSSGNLISRNAFDFCIRGYSHGVYNRGQDSAGILMFEQCSRNLVIENSVTHGGDGLFAFAGKEALGEVSAPEGYNYTRAGNNDNLFVGNDFSFAAAHGLELTFSFGNVIADNTFQGNAICGIWGGYSRDLMVVGNRFRDNGERGYGLERGGLNVDHPGALSILDNTFTGDWCGVHLWDLANPFAETPWGQANLAEEPSLLLDGNVFDSRGPCVQLRGVMKLGIGDNSFRSAAKEVDFSEGAAALPFAQDDLAAEQRALAKERLAPAQEAALGNSRPLGKRRYLGGREAIVMTPWGPWDHQAPLILRLADRADGAHGYTLLPAEAPLEEIAVTGAVEMRPTRSEDGQQQFWILPDEIGLTDYRLELRVGGEELWMPGRFLTADWRVLVFPTPIDPREDEASWHKATLSPEAQEFRPRELDLRYGNGGANELFGTEGLPSDHFGTLARAGLRLPAGKWRLHLRSDDGVRLYLDGERKIDDWTWHAPRDATLDLRLTRAQSVPIRIEHFELDGYAWLSLEVEQLD